MVKKMYDCSCCGARFEELDSSSFCYEDVYGLTHDFPDRHYGSFACCPECGSGEWDEVYILEISYALPRDRRPLKTKLFSGKVPKVDPEEARDILWQC